MIYMYINTKVPWLVLAVQVYLHLKVLYACLLCTFWQLNRSDSDSSTLAKKSLFVRNATERRSLRVKRVCAVAPGRALKWRMGRAGIPNDIKDTLYFKYFSRSDSSTAVLSCSLMLQYQHSGLSPMSSPLQQSLCCFSRGWSQQQDTDAQHHGICCWTLVTVRGIWVKEPEYYKVTQKSAPAIYILSEFWWRFQGFRSPLKGNLLSTKSIQVAKGLKDKRLRFYFSCMKFTYINLESYILILIVTRRIVLWKPCYQVAGYILHKKE